MTLDLRVAGRDPALLSTGVRQLDEFLGGGLDRGTFILLIEPSGAGGEIFAKQFAAGAPGGRSVFISTEETAAEIGRTFDRFGFPTRPEVVSVSETHSKRVLERRHATTRSLHVATARELISTVSSDATKTYRPESDDLLEDLLKPYSAGTPPERLTVHTVDFFLGLYGVEKVMDTLTALRATNQQAGGLVLLVLTDGSPLRAAAEGFLDRISSCTIELEFKRRGAQFEKFLLVKKVRNKFLGVGVAPYSINERGFELDNLNRIL